MEWFVLLEGEDGGKLNREGLEEVIDGKLRQQSEQLLEAGGGEEVMDVDFLEYLSKDVINTVLTLTGEKRGTIPVGVTTSSRIPDLDGVMSYADAVTSMGGDVYIHNQYFTDGEIDVHVPNLFVTSDRSFRNEEISDIPVFGDNDFEIGVSLGFPEEEVKAFEEYGMWPEGMDFKDGEFRVAKYEKGTDYAFSAPVLAREKEEDFDYEALSLLSYTIRDTYESLARAERTGKRYKRTLEEAEKEYDVDILDEVEVL